MSADKFKCEPCRTINLAKQIRQQKPDMQMYEKCSPAEKFDCCRIPEVPLTPTCIKVCTRGDDIRSRCDARALAASRPYYAHGKLMYAIKAGLLAGAVYFTYRQGVWGTQREVSECIRRWQEYFKSLNTRRPPTFDEDGNVVRKEPSGGSSGSIISPLYNVYKEIVTTCFAGVVKVPMIIKCAYIDYLKALERKYEQDEKERKIKKRG